MKRAQMEIMGLVIIVILLIVGVLFALKFVVLKEPSTVRQNYANTQLASNFGIAMMSSSSGCRQTSIKTLLIDCAENAFVGGSISCGNGLKSCEYVNNTITTIVNSTLVSWNKQFYINAQIADDDPIIYFHSAKCSADKVQPGESESFFLPVKSSHDVLTLKVFICS
jgi:hypothetical protein